jgi:hypothetical protein
MLAGERIADVPDDREARRARGKRPDGTRFQIVRVHEAGRGVGNATPSTTKPLSTEGDVEHVDSDTSAPELFGERPVLAEYDMGAISGQRACDVCQRGRSRRELCRSARQEHDRTGVCAHGHSIGPRLCRARVNA